MLPKQPHNTAVPTIHNQMVLPETIEHLMGNTAGDISFAHRDLLREKTFTSHEVRDEEGIPGINIIYENTADRDPAEQTLGIIARARHILELAGLSEHDVKPLTVILDPTDIPFKAGSAFYNGRHHHLWVKARGKVFGEMEHELSHWATLSCFKTIEDQPYNQIITEGLAVWMTWQTLSDDPRILNTIADYKRVVHAYSKYNLIPEKLFFNINGDNIVNGALGACLIEALIENHTGGFQALMQDYVNFDWSNHTISDAALWISAMGMDVNKVHSQWQSKIDYLRENDPNAGIRTIAQQH